MFKVGNCGVFVCPLWFGQFSPSRAPSRPADGHALARRSVFGSSSLNCENMSRFPLSFGSKTSSFGTVHKSEAEPKSETSENGSSKLSKPKNPESSILPTAKETPKSEKRKERKYCMVKRDMNGKGIEEALLVLNIPIIVAHTHHHPSSTYLVVFLYLMEPSHSEVIPRPSFAEPQIKIVRLASISRKKVWLLYLALALAGRSRPHQRRQIASRAHLPRGHVEPRS